MANSVLDLAADGTPPPKRRSFLQRLLITLLKLAIAVLGIGWVVWNVTWYDKATIPAGEQIRQVTFVDDTPVVVLKQYDQPERGPRGASLTLHLVLVRFPDRPVNVEVGGVRAKVHINEHEVVPGQGELNIPQEIVLPLDYFKPIKKSGGKRVIDGLRAPLIAAGARWYLLVIAWALLVIPFLVSAVRWRALMKPQGIVLPLRKCLQLTFVGQFYSIMLPGVTGGDLVKIAYAAQLTGSKTKSLITILLDRAIGLVALMVIGGASAGFQLWANHKSGGGPADSTLQNVFILIVVLLAIMGTGATIYFSLRLRRLIGIQWFIDTFAHSPNADTPERHQHLERLYRRAVFLTLGASMLVGAAAAILKWTTRLKWAQHNGSLLLGIVIAMAAIALLCLLALLAHGKLIERLMPLLVKMVALVVHMDETLHTYRGHVGLLTWAFGISLVSQLMLPLAGWLSGMAFGMNANVGYYLAYVPIAVLASSLPVSPPQGFGVMDYILAHFFAERGGAAMGRVIALTQAIRFLPILWNLVGAYWVVRGRFSRHEIPEGVEIQ